MGVYIAAAGLILAAVAQVSVLPYATGEGAAVDLVLLLVVAWGIIRGVHEGLLWGLIGGLALDAVSIVPFGTTAVVLGAIGLLSGLRHGQLRRGSVIWALFAAALATIVYDGLTMALLAVLGREWNWLAAFRETVLPSAALNALAMLPIYGLLLLIHRRSEPKIKW